MSLNSARMPTLADKIEAQAAESVKEVKHKKVETKLGEIKKGRRLNK